VFQGSVAGLSVAGDVLYNGIKVGEVTNIDLDPDNPDHVLVRIRVRKDTPVKNDSVASMDSQGLTGVANILISGGTEKAGPLTAAQNQQYPIIPTKKSAFQELFAGTPELINRGNKLLERAAQFLNDDNQKIFADTLNDVHRLTKNLANASDRLDSITASVDQLTKNTNALIAGDAKQTFADVRGVAADIRLIVNDARGPLRDFARAGLPELLLLISDTRQMIGTVDRAAQRFESSPSSILFGDKASEYNPGGK
jgi:phospholipid/cholesterol/gamma-HCH transport system substrate-binding protein